MMTSVQRVLVYGGRGALGAAVVDYFKARSVYVVNVDLEKNDAADSNVIVDPLECWIEQESRVLKGVESFLGNERLDGILCVAGGWAGGNSAHKDFIKNADLVWKQSVWSSAISARLGSQFLKPGGLLQLTGASAAVQGTPAMIGYGFSKAAVHQMVSSLADWKAAGLPESSVVLAILPITLDTPMNRKWMPKADFSTWTPLKFVAETLYKWTYPGNDDGKERPVSGSLMKLITKDGLTELSID